MNVQSMLDPAGVQAAHIERLWWVFLAVSTIVYVLVIGALVAAIVRRRRSDRPTSERTLTRTVGIATVATAAILIVLLTADGFTARALTRLESDDHIVIDITGRQWWWDIEYQHPDPSMRVRTANELRLPVGRAVQINLHSNDVIHSFWVPALNGKRDLIPGHETEIWVRADKPGRYRGQCAEFCGLQHAHMALTVIVESQDTFQKWLTGQRGEGPSVDSQLAQRGRMIVEHGPCGTCHTVRGTEAGGRVAPDLTHVATRESIAAGALPTSASNLRRWIDDPQHFKPGSRMPALGLRGEDLDAVVAYLGGAR